VGDQVQRVLLGQCARDRDDERHLEAVEDPRDSEADDDQPVPTVNRKRSSRRGIIVSTASPVSPSSVAAVFALMH